MCSQYTHGTLAMPSMSSDDDWPFEPRATSCIELGIVADSFWRLPGVHRSASPYAFAAVGPRATLITVPHPVDVPHGPDSPAGRIYALDGQVLLLGVGHDANTTIHLAETLANVPYRRRKYVTVLEQGRPVRVDYGEIDHCCQNFALVDGWLDARGWQRTGRVGHAVARLARARDVVAVVTAQFATDPLVFLHPSGVDEECDEARAGVSTAQAYL